jgi:hypothetical protein
MNAKVKLPGDVVREISLHDLLISITIYSLRLAVDLTQTDAAFGDGWSFDQADRLAAYSDLCRLVLTGHAELLRDVIIPLPDDILGMVIANPLKGNSMEKPTDGSVGLSHEGGDNFPF